MPQQILCFRSPRRDAFGNWHRRQLGHSCFGRVPQRSSGRIYLLVLNYSIFLMPVREGGYFFESRGLWLCGSSMTIHLKPKAVKTLLSGVSRPGKPLASGPVRRSSVVPFSAGVLGPTRGRGCHQPVPVVIFKSRQSERNADVHFSQSS